MVEPGLLFRHVYSQYRLLYEIKKNDDSESLRLSSPRQSQPFWVVRRVVYIICIGKWDLSPAGSIYTSNYIVVHLLAQLSVDRYGQLPHLSRTQRLERSPGPSLTANLPRYTRTAGVAADGRSNTAYATERKFSRD